jgi:hypothetical protein
MTPLESRIGAAALAGAFIGTALRVGSTPVAGEGAPETPVVEPGLSPAGNRGLTRRDGLCCNIPAQGTDCAFFRLYIVLALLLFVTGACVAESYCCVSTHLGPCLLLRGSCSRTNDPENISAETMRTLKACV